MPNPFDVGYYTSEELRTMGFAHVGNHVLVAKNCSIHGLHQISLGDHVRIDGFCTITATDHPVRIGSYIHIGAYCLLSGSSGITLEDFSGLSHGVKIFSSSDDYSGRHLTNSTVPDRFKNIHRGAVHLHKHVIVGAGSVILPGVTLEEGSAVGALSLVRKNIPAWSIFAGYPAKHVSERSRDLLALELQLRQETRS